MRQSCAGLVLAGGKGSRMQGADKGLLKLNGQMFAEHLLISMAPYVQEQWLSCNRNHLRYSQFVPCLSDGRWQGAGPLAGIERALNVITASHLLVVPCDTPLLDAGFFKALLDQADQHPDRIIATTAGGRSHPLHAVIPKQFQAALAAYLEEGGRAVMGWYESSPVHWFEWQYPDQLFNINTRTEFEQAVQHSLPQSRPRTYQVPVSTRIYGGTAEQTLTTNPVTLTGGR